MGKLTRYKCKILILIALFSFSITCSAKDFYVSPKGKDTNKGTRLRPFLTPEKASQMALEELSTGKEDVTIWFDAGDFLFTKPLIISGKDLIKSKNLLIFKAMKGKNPVFSGGVEIKNWKRKKSGIWEAQLSEEFADLICRELFINDKRAIRARFPNDGYLRVKKAGADRRTNFFFENKDFPIPDKVENTELILLHDWSISRIAVKDIDKKQRKLTAVDSIGAKSPEFFNIDNWEPNPRYFLENAPEFIDKDYEWCYDPKERLIQLKLPKSEKPSRLKISIPVSEGLIQMIGTENEPVKNIRFEGITFQYSKWDIPEKGYCGVQACHFDPRPEKSGWAVVPAAIFGEWCSNCTFLSCHFRNLGGSGVWLGTGAKNCRIANSVFTDISGNGIMIGEGQDREVSGDKWWKTEPSQVAQGNRIEDCKITECGTQFYGAIGIWCGLTALTKISGNEICDLPYSGISVGWMWSPIQTPCRANSIENNHIHHIMNILSDGGGIYMLGLQPGSKISGNRIHDVHLNAGKAESNGMFLDEGITDVLVSDNLIYNIAKSPIRFHKATTNTVRDNYLFCKKGTPPFRYNATKENDIRKINNQVFTEQEENYEKELNNAVLNWKK